MNFESMEEEITNLCEELQITEDNDLNESKNTLLVKNQIKKYLINMKGCKRETDIFFNN
jgi:hypothetical protein